MRTWTLLKAVLLISIALIPYGGTSQEVHGGYVADVTVLSAGEAYAAAKAWAGWLEEDLQPQPCEQVETTPLRYSYTFLTLSGEHKVTVAQENGVRRLRWTNLRVAAEVESLPVGPQRDGVGEAEKRQIQQQWMQRYCPRQTGGEFVWYGRFWRFQLKNGALLLGRSRSMRTDPRTGEVYDFYESYSRVPVGLEPGVSLTEATAAARALLARLPGIQTIAEVKPGNIGGYGGGLYVQGDELGVQRLVYGFDALVSGAKLSQAEYRDMTQAQRDDLFHRIPLVVDARTGRALTQGLENYGLPGRAPALKIGEHEVDPEYPPVVRARVPYLYVGYLSSLVWPGEVQTGPDSAEVAYRGRKWQLRAGQSTVAADEETRSFAQVPRLFEGYLYVPSDIIAAITGWHVDYVAHERAVYVYSRLGEGPGPPTASSSAPAEAASPSREALP